MVSDVREDTVARGYELLPDTLDQFSFGESASMELRARYRVVEATGKRHPLNRQLRLARSRKPSESPGRYDAAHGCDGLAGAWGMDRRRGRCTTDGVGSLGCAWATKEAFALGAIVTVIRAVFA